jgi:hypothetical protein
MIRVVFHGVPMVFLSSNICPKETRCAFHLRVPNELWQNMFIIECLRTWCAHADFILQGWLFTNVVLPNRVCPCAGWLSTYRGGLTRPPSIVFVHLTPMMSPWNSWNPYWLFNHCARSASPRLCKEAPAASQLEVTPKAIFFETNKHLRKVLTFKSVNIYIYINVYVSNCFYLNLISFMTPLSFEFMGWW